MNCENVRELFSTDPRCQIPEALQHTEECANCAEWLAELQHFEMELSEAMQVDIPEGLEQRILEQQGSNNTSNAAPLHRIITPHRWHSALAIAASLLLIVGLVTSLNIEQPFEQQMTAWLSTQQPAQYLDQQASDAEVDKMFRMVGAELIADIGVIHHCQVTQVQDHQVGYFVISGDQGPISVMLVANDSKSIFIQGAISSQDERRIKESIRWI